MLRKHYPVPMYTLIYASIDKANVIFHLQYFNGK